MRAILYLILIISLYIFVKNLIKPKPIGTRDKIRSKAEDMQVGSEMVHDLYCNTFIPKESAIKEVVKGKAYYFCSQECFNKFRAGNI